MPTDSLGVLVVTMEVDMGVDMGVDKEADNEDTFLRFDWCDYGE